MRCSLVSNKIIQARERLGLTQQQLAEKLCVTNKAVSKWECGVTLPDISLLVPLCRVLGLTVQELLEQLCREPAYAAFQFPVLVLSGLEQGMPLADAWESGIRQDKAIPETGKNLLLPLGEELGASDLDGQTATLSQYRRQLEPYAAEAGELCRRKQRLYCSLGVLGLSLIHI